MNMWYLNSITIILITMGYQKMIDILLKEIVFIPRILEKMKKLVNFKNIIIIIRLTKKPDYRSI